MDIAESAVMHECICICVREEKDKERGRKEKKVEDLTLYGQEYLNTPKQNIHVELLEQKTPQAVVQ